MTARSAQPSRGLGLVRRSTATSCRSTSTSASLDLTSGRAGTASRIAGRRSGRAGGGTRLTIMPHGRTPPIAAGHRNRPNLGTGKGVPGPGTLRRPHRLVLRHACPPSGECAAAQAVADAVARAAGPPALAVVGRRGRGQAKPSRTAGPRYAIMVRHGALHDAVVGAGVPGRCERWRRSGAASAGRSSRSAPSGPPQRRPCPARCGSNDAEPVRAMLQLHMWRPASLPSAATRRCMDSASAPSRPMISSAAASTTFRVILPSGPR